MEGIGTLGLSCLYLNAGTFDKYVLDATNTPVAQGQFTANSLAAGRLHGSGGPDDLVVGESNATVAGRSAGLR